MIELVEDLDALQRRAAALKTEAEAVTQAYDRTSWIRYALFFIPVPLFLLLFKSSIDALGYIVAGAIFLTVAAVMVALDGAAAAKRDDAIAAAERARKACEEARAADPKLSI